MADLTLKHDGNYICSNGSPMGDLAISCGEWAKVDLTDVSEVAAQILKTSLRYYCVVEKQAEKSFRCALWFAGIGTGFFILSVLFAALLAPDPLPIGLLPGSRDWHDPCIITGDGGPSGPPEVRNRR